MDSPGPKAVLTIVLVCAILAYTAYTLVNTPGTVSMPNPPTRFTVNGHTFVITYLAANQSARDSGLMNKKITNETTMLFVFPAPGIYSFWMGNVNSSLDMIWLNVTGDVGRVVYLKTDVPVCSATFCPVYQPPVAANYVLEAKGGFAESNGIGSNTAIQFS